MTRIALIGAGGMARAHAEAFNDVPEAELVAIHSRTRSRAEALASELGIAAVCDSVEALVEHRPDLLLITTTETATRDIALRALATGHGWALLLEKPPGLTPAETAEIATAAAQAQARVYVGLNRQWISATQAILTELEQFPGQRTVVVEDAEDLAVADALGYSPEIKAHWMYANSIHLVDYFRYLCRGEVTGVQPVVAWNPAAPNHVVSKIDFSSGDVGIYRAVWDAPGPWAVSVFAPTHRWELRPLERAITQRADERPGREMPVHAWDKAFKPGFRLQAQHAIAAARGEATPLPTIEDGLASMQLVERIYPEPARA